MEVKEADEDIHQSNLEELKNRSPEPSKNESSRRSTPTSVLEIEDEIFLDVEQYKLR